MFLQFQFLAGSFLGPGFHSVSMDVTSLKPCDGLGIAAPFGSAWTHFTEEDDSDGVEAAQQEIPDDRRVNSFKIS